MYNLIMYIVMLFRNLYDRQYNLSAINFPEMRWGEGGGGGAGFSSQANNTFYSTDTLSGQTNFIDCKRLIISMTKNFKAKLFTFRSTKELLILISVISIKSGITRIYWASSKIDVHSKLYKNLLLIR